MSVKKRAGSEFGSVTHWDGSTDPDSSLIGTDQDRFQNVKDPEHAFIQGPSLVTQYAHRKNSYGQCYGSRSA
jgi:hypothetical protein